jgi:RNA 3'-terminal phosphate cyclase (ATP)
LNPALANFGLTFDCNIIRRGYYPKGGGEVILITTPIKELNPINFENRGSIDKITGKSWTAGAVPKHVRFTTYVW